jgi:GNAT superfamily N-acetyltransferase
LTEDARVVRSARADDLPRVLGLLEQLIEEHEQESIGCREPIEAQRIAFSNMGEHPDYRLLVLEDKGGIFATCALYVVPNLSHGGAPWAIIENVVVDAGMRGKGYGATLMNEAVRLAREAGCYRVSLMSNNRRGGAHEFYRRIGFTESHHGFTRYFS